MSTTLKERCLKGARLLDEKCPSWRRDVDVLRLVMAQDNNDVIAQLFGSAQAGREFLGITEFEDVSYGFNDVRFEELTDIWRAITLRQPLPEGNWYGDERSLKRIYED